MSGKDQPDGFAHFVAAQDFVYARVVDELRRGEKRSHWMWFIFPQLAGLGRSERAQRFGLASREDAALYAAHPLLGARLRDCTKIVLGIERRAEEIFGQTDAMKFRSSMTLFDAAVPGEFLFDAALQRFCGGERDDLTLNLLAHG
jgi:uncharacterized protein (DUF1810 family)